MLSTNRRARAGIAGLAIVASGCAPSRADVDAQYIVDWMNTYYAVARVERLSPPVAARIFAYGAVALYEGLALTEPALRSLAGQLNGLDALPEPPPDVRLDPVIVGVTAELELLSSLLAEASMSTQNRLHEVAERQTQARIAAVSREVHAASEAHGRALGAALAEWARQDAFVDTRQLVYQPTVGEGAWINTTRPSEYTAQSVSAAVDYVAVDNPAATINYEVASERSLLMDRPRRATLRNLTVVNPTGALEPHWGRLRPFALTEGGECPAPEPAAFSTDPNSAFHAEARATYQAVNELTAEQRGSAFFWADNPGQTGTPPGHWISILAQAATQQGLSASATAEALVLLSAGLTDAFITCWDTKYRHNVLRPSTYIRRYIDADWSTVVVTPPFPEYTSGHSVASAAAATILMALLGDLAFVDATHVSLGHAPRTFDSFEAAAREAAASRLYGGIHYPMAIEAGLAQGRCVGSRVMERLRTRS